MATEAEISKPISEKNIRGEELQKGEGELNPPAKIVENSTETQHTQAATSVRNEIVNPVIKGDGISEGENFLESPSLAVVAIEDTCRASDNCEANENLSLMETEKSENETQLQKDKTNEAIQKKYSTTERDKVDDLVKQVSLDMNLENERTKDRDPTKASELSSEEKNIKEYVREKLPSLPISVEPNLQEGQIEKGKREAMDENKQTYEELSNNELDNLPVSKDSEGKKLEESPNLVFEDQNLDLVFSIQNIDKNQKREERTSSNLDTVTTKEISLQKGETEEPNLKVEEGNEIQKEKEIPGQEIETVPDKHASIEENPHNIEQVEVVSASQKDEIEDQRSGEDPDLEFGKQVHKALKAATDHNQEALSLVPNLNGESLKTDIADVTDTFIKVPCIDKNCHTDTASMKQDLKDTSYQGIKCKEHNKSSNIEDMEKDPKTVSQIESMEDEKQKGEENPQDDIRDSSDSMVMESSKIQNDEEIIETGEGINDKLNIPYVTMVTDETSLHKDEFQGGKHEETYSLALKEKSQETIDSSEMMEDKNSNEDEIHDKDNLETSVIQATEGTHFQEQDRPQIIEATSEMGLENIGNNSHNDVDPQNEILETIAIAESTINETSTNDDNPVNMLDGSKCEMLVLPLTEASIKGNKDKDVFPVIEAKDNIEVIEIIEARENSQQETSKDGEVFEQSLQKDKAEEEKVEKPLDVVSEELETAASCADAEKDTCKREEGSSKNLKESFEEKRKGGKINENDDAREHRMPKEEKQVHEGHGTEKIEEAFGVRENMESTISGQEKITDGPPTLGLISKTSQTEVEKPEKACELDFKEKLEDMDTSGDIENEMGTKEETSEVGLHKIETEGEEIEKWIKEEDSHNTDNSTVSFGNETVDKNSQVDEKEAPLELKGEDQSWKTNDTNEATKNENMNEVGERHQIASTGNDTEKQIIEEKGTIMDLCTEPIREETFRKDSREVEKEMKMHGGEVCEGYETICERLETSITSDNTERQIVEENSTLMDHSTAPIGEKTVIESSQEDEVHERLETADACEETERQILEEYDAVMDLSMVSVVEETVQESSLEDEKEAEKLERVVKESDLVSIRQNFGATGSTEEVEMGTAKNEKDPNKNPDASCVAASREEMLLKESSEKFAVHEEKIKEDMEKAEISKLGAAYVTSLQEAEAEGENLVDDLASEEKNLATTETSWTSLQNQDIKGVKLDEILTLSENTEKDILIAEKQDVDEVEQDMKCERKVEASDTVLGFKHQCVETTTGTDITSSKAPLDEKSEEQLQESSTLTPKEQELESTGASEKIKDENPMEDEIEDEKPEAQREKPMKLEEVSDMGTEGIVMECSNEEIQKDDGEKRKRPPELYSEKHISESKNADAILEREKTTELTEPCKNSKPETSKDKEILQESLEEDKSDGRKPFYGVSKGPETTGACANNEKDILDHEKNHVKNLAESSDECVKGGERVETVAVQLEDSNQSYETNEGLDTIENRNLQDKNLEHIDPSEKFERANELVAEDQSNETHLKTEQNKNEIVSEAVEDQNTAHVEDQMVMQNFQKEEKDSMNLKNTGDKLEEEVHTGKTNNTNENKKSAIINEEVPKGVDKAEASKDVEKQIAEEVGTANNLHMVSVEDGTVSEVKDSGLVDTEWSIKQTAYDVSIETGNLKQVDDLNNKPETSHVTESSKEGLIIKEGSDNFVDITNSVSEVYENKNKEIFEESETSHNKLNTSSIIMVTKEMSLQESEAEVEKLVGAADIGSEEKSLGTVETAETSPQDEEFKKMKLDETSDLEQTRTGDPSHETSKSFDTLEHGTFRDENLEDIDPGEKLQRVYESVAEDQSHQTLSETEQNKIEDSWAFNYQNTAYVEYQTVMQNLQEEEKDSMNLEDTGYKLEAEDHTEKTNETKKNAILNEEVPEGVDKAEASKDIKKQIVEEVGTAKELHTVSIRDGTLKEVKDSGLVATEWSIKQTAYDVSTETGNLKHVDDLNNKPETCHVTESSKESIIIKEGSDNFVDITNSVSEVSEKEIKEIFKESETSNNKLNTSSIIMVTEETSLEESEAEVEKLVGASDIGSKEKSLETVETAETSSQDEEFKMMKLDETSDLEQTRAGDPSHETSKSFDSLEHVTPQDENLEDVDPVEKLQPVSASVAEVQSHQTLFETEQKKIEEDSRAFKDHNTASVEYSMVIQNLQEEEKDSMNLEDTGHKLGAEDHTRKTDNTNETKKSVILNEEVPERVDKAEASKDVEKQIEEEVGTANILHRVSVEDGTVSEVKDSSVVATEWSIKQTAYNVSTETGNLKHVDDLNNKPEASHVTESSEEGIIIKGGSDNFVEITNSVSEVSEKEIKEIFEESETSNDKLNTASIIVVTEETSLQESEPEVGKFVGDPDIGSEEKSLGPVETAETSSQDEEFKKMKLDETSDLVIQLSSGGENADKENLKVKKIDADEVEEEIKLSSDTVSKPGDQVVEAIDEAETTAGWIPAAEESEEKLEETSAFVSKQELERTTATENINEDMLKEHEILEDENLEVPFNIDTTDEMCLQKEEEPNELEQTSEIGCKDMKKECPNEEPNENEGEKLDNAPKLDSEMHEFVAKDADSLLVRENITKLTEAGENNEMKTSKDEPDLQKEETQGKKFKIPCSEVCEELDTGGEKANTERNASEKDDHVKILEESPEEEGKNPEPVDPSKKTDTPDTENPNKKIDDSPITHSLVEETLQECGDFGEASNLEFMKLERDFESMSKAQNHEILTEMKKNELEENGCYVKVQDTIPVGDEKEGEHLEEAGPELESEDQSEETNANDPTKKKNSKEEEPEGLESVGASETIENHITGKDKAVKDPYLASVGEEIVKEAHQEDKKEEKKIEEAAIKLEVEFENQALEGKEDQREKIIKANDATKCEILIEEVSEGLESADTSENIRLQIAEEKQAVPYLISEGEKTCKDSHQHDEKEGKKVNEAEMKLNPEDHSQESKAEEDLRDKGNEANETMKCEILNEVVSMGVENAEASDKTGKQLTEEERSLTDPYLASIGEETVKKNHQEEEKNEKKVEEEATKLNPEDQNHEAKCKDDSTENYILNAEIKSSHFVLVEQKLETIGSTNNIETVTIKDKGDPEKNVDVSPTAKAPVEEAPKKVGNEPEEVSHLVPKELIHESIKTNEENKDNATEVEKLKNTSSVSASNPSDTTEDMHLKDQEVPTNNLDASSLIEASEEVPEQGCQMTEDEDRQSLVFVKQAIAEVSLPKGDMEENHIKDEAPVEEEKKGDKMNDDAQIQETTSADEGRETSIPQQEDTVVFLSIKQATAERSIRGGTRELDTNFNMVIEKQNHKNTGLVSEVHIHESEKTQSANLEDADSLNEKLSVLSDIQPSAQELSQKEATVILPEVTEDPRHIEKLEKASDANPEEQTPRKLDLIESTDTKIPTGHKDILSVPQDVIGKPLEIDEEESQKPGEVLGNESEEKGVECGLENKMQDAVEETAEEPKPSDTDKVSLSDLLSRSTKETLHMVAGDLNPPLNNEELQNKDLQTIQVEEKTDVEEKDEEEEEDEHKKADTGPDARVMVEASRDVDVKPTHKKSHNILSGVGSKVKHSIAKVKKAITGKSSHSKPLSPK